jgi:hypothetical protein
VNPLAIVVFLIGLYMVILGFRNKQGDLITGITGKPFAGLGATVPGGIGVGHKTMGPVPK